MEGAILESRVQRRLIDALYVEAMVLADEARTYFDQGAQHERHALDPLQRVAFSCESLKVTTRLMHVIAWLLTQRAIATGEMTQREALDPSRRLGAPPVTDSETLAVMPAEAQALISASIDLFRRTARLDAVQAGGIAVESPVLSMMERLEVAF